MSNNFVTEQPVVEALIFLKVNLSTIFSWKLILEKSIYRAIHGSFLAAPTNIRSKIWRGSLKKKPLAKFVPKFPII